MLVTAIMPTRGRQVWANQALKCFLAQTYERKQLIIIDDADDPSFPVAPPIIHGPVLHVLLKERLTIPEKRNMGVRVATGEIIWHLDSDDFSAPNRMAEQVALLQESGASLVGYHSLLFHSEKYGAWKFNGRSGYPMGTSFCYLRSFWERHPFERDPNSENEHVGEDGMFSRAARQENAVVSVDGGLLQVARIHDGNTSRKEIHNREHQEWQRWTGGLPEEFRP